MNPQNKALLVRLYYENQHSESLAFRRYQSVRNVKKPPCTRQTLLNLVKKFEETGNLCDRKRSGRPQVQPEVIESIASAIDSQASSSELRIASAHMTSRSLGIPWSTVRKVLKVYLHRYPYRISRLQALQDSDLPKRLNYAHWMLNKVETTPGWLHNVLWSDEAHFSLDGLVNTHNCRIWLAENPKAVQGIPLHSPKVTVWCGFTSTFILGPYFFEDEQLRTTTVTGCRYEDMLRTQIIPNLRQHDFLEQVIFMHDGAPPHIDRPVTRLLHDVFGHERIIGRNCQNPWPPRSPDLNPCDFWLWGYLKSRVYRSKPASLLALKNSITYEILDIRTEMLQSAVNNVIPRLIRLADREGGHIENE